MIRPMTRKQQLITALACGLLLLLAILTAVMFLFQQEPERPEDLPGETTALSTEATTESIHSTETSTSTTAAATSTTAADTSATTTGTTSAAETTQTSSTEQTTTATIVTEVIPVESITLTFYEVQLYVGGTAMPIVTMHPSNASDQSELWASADKNIASVNGYGRITANAAGECLITVTSVNNPAVSTQVRVIVLERPATEPPATEAPTEPPATEAPATQAPSPAAPSEPTYIGGILIANKTYALPKDYNPGLDPTCKAQFDLLSQAAAAEGLNIWLASGFRSYDRQKTIYNNYLNWYGQEKTDTLSARPGHSEHQTGLAIDVNSVTDSFGATPEAAWLAEHAHEFGFIIRYPKGKEHITGYKYEPWHIRYLGVDMATTIYNSGLTLEEYLGITSCYAE